MYYAATCFAFPAGRAPDRIQVAPLELAHSLLLAGAWKRGQPKLFEELIMFLPRAGNRPFHLDQFPVRLSEIDFRLRGCRADVARNVEIVSPGFIGALAIVKYGRAGRARTS